MGRPDAVTGSELAVWAVVPAAGRGTRFRGALPSGSANLSKRQSQLVWHRRPAGACTGETPVPQRPTGIGSKSLAPFGGRSMLAAVLDAMEASRVVGVAVVVSPEVAGVIESERPAGPRRVFVLNDKPQSEMIESVQLGLVAAAWAAIGKRSTWVHDTLGGPSGAEGCSHGWSKGRQARAKPVVARRRSRRPRQGPRSPRLHAPVRMPAFPPPLPGRPRAHTNDHGLRPGSPGLHPWLQPIAPSGAKTHPPILSRTRSTSSGPQDLDAGVPLNDRIPLPDACAGYLICPGDHPCVTAKVINQCVAAFVASPRAIVIAAHAGRRGHPIILPAEVARVVASWPSTERLDTVRTWFADRVLLIETDEPGVLVDVDTPEDLDRAVRQSGCESGRG